MDIQISVLISQAINFLVLLGLFKWMIGDRLTQAIVERKNSIALAKEAEGQYKQALQDAELEKKAIIQEGLEHKDKVIAQAVLTAKQKADEILAFAEKEAQQIRTMAKEQAAKVEKELYDNYIDSVKTTSRLVVNKLFTQNQDLKDAYLEELATEFSTSV